MQQNIRSVIWFCWLGRVRSDCASTEGQLRYDVSQIDSEHFCRTVFVSFFSCMRLWCLPAFVEHPWLCIIRQRSSSGYFFIFISTSQTRANRQIDPNTWNAGSLTNIIANAVMWFCIIRSGFVLLSQNKWMEQFGWIGIFVWNFAVRQPSFSPYMRVHCMQYVIKQLHNCCAHFGKERERESHRSNIQLAHGDIVNWHSNIGSFVAMISAFLPQPLFILTPQQIRHQHQLDFSTTVHGRVDSSGQCMSSTA